MGLFMYRYAWNFPAMFVLDVRRKGYKQVREIQISALHWLQLLFEHFSFCICILYRRS